MNETKTERMNCVRALAGNHKGRVRESEMLIHRIAKDYIGPEESHASQKYRIHLVLRGVQCSRYLYVRTHLQANFMRLCVHVRACAHTL